MNIDTLLTYLYYSLIAVSLFTIIIYILIKKEEQ